MSNPPNNATPTTPTTPAQTPRPPSYFPGLVVALLLVLTLIVSSVVVVNWYDRHNPRQVMMFDGYEPGSDEATEALDFAQRADIDAVINYSSINVNGPEIAAYLKEAQQRDVKIIISLKDLLGNEDLDPAHQEYHEQFGRGPNDEVGTIDQQVADIVKLTRNEPAVGGYLITDERPTGPGSGPTESDIWLPKLRHRYEQVRGLTDLPIMGVFWYEQGDHWVPFLESVHSDAKGKPVDMELGMDHYPYPEIEGQTMGKISNIRQIGRELDQVAPRHNFFVFQAGSWTNEPDTAKKFGFGPNPPAPPADVMVQMCRLALEGGAHDLVAYSYPWIKNDPKQQQELIKAVARIRNLPEFD